MIIENMKISIILPFSSVDGGSLETGCVAVEGAANVISRENAALIFNRTEVSNQSINN